MELSLPGPQDAPPAGQGPPGWCGCRPLLGMPRQETLWAPLCVHQPAQCGAQASVQGHHSRGPGACGLHLGHRLRGQRATACQPGPGMRARSTTVSGCRQPGRRTLVRPMRHVHWPVTRAFGERQLRDESDVWRYPTHEYQCDPPSQSLPASRHGHDVARSRIIQ